MLPGKLQKLFIFGILIWMQGMFAESNSTVLLEGTLVNYNISTPESQSNVSTGQQETTVTTAQLESNATDKQKEIIIKLESNVTVKQKETTITTNLLENNVTDKQKETLIQPESNVTDKQKETSFQLESNITDTHKEITIQLLESNVTDKQKETTKSTIQLIQLDHNVTDEQKNATISTIQLDHNKTDKQKETLQLESNVTDKQKNNTITIQTESNVTDEQKETTISTIQLDRNVTDEQKETTISTIQLGSNETETQTETMNVTTKSPPADSTTPDFTAICTKYSKQSISKQPAVQFKTEPSCTQSGAPLDQLMKFIGFQFPKHQCGNKNSTEKYTQIAFCSMLNAHTKCLQSTDTEQTEIQTEVVPQMSTVKFIIEELCSISHSLNKVCFVKQLNHVSKCIKTEVDSIFAMLNKEWKYGTLDLCRHLEVKVLCMYESLEPCGEQTASFMAGLVNTNFRSETCSLSSGGQMMQPFAHISFQSVVITLVLVLIRLV